MKLFPRVSHVDRLNVIAPPFESVMGAIAGPYCVAAHEVYSTGAAEGDLFVSGAAQSEVFVAGARAGQVIAQ